MISPAISKASRDVTSRRNHRGTKARFTSGPAVGGAQAPGVGDGRIVPEMTWERLGSPTWKTWRKARGPGAIWGFPWDFGYGSWVFWWWKNCWEIPERFLWVLMVNGKIMDFWWILVHFYRQLWLPDDHLKWFSCQNNLTSNVSSILLNFVAGKSWFLSKPR